jgi:hypothetical protein
MNAIIRSICVLFVWGSVAACALPAQLATRPLYDFETVFLNDDMIGQKPWRAPDHAAIRAALQLSSRSSAATEPRSHARQRPRSITSIRPPTAPRSVTPTPSLSPAPRARRAQPVTPRTPTASKPPVVPRTARKIPLTHIAVPDIPEFDLPAPPVRSAGLILGDGSVSGELVAAAARLVGLGPAMDPMAFVEHLQKTAAVRFVDASPPAVAGVWDALESRGLTYGSGDRPPQPGDLVFFHHVADVDGDGRSDALSGVGVVEEVQEETLVCILPALGAVRRIPTTPGQSAVRRRSGRVLNVPVRPRGYGADGPVLSGQLVAGFARL